MLTALSIRNVVLIEALDLEFAPGLGVLTGETGAGKSILLDSLGLALGMRADSGLVRNGEAQASVTASFDPGVAGARIAALAEQSGLEMEPGEPILIRRTLKADGGSRAFLNDQPCSAGLGPSLLRSFVEAGSYLPPASSRQALARPGLRAAFEARPRGAFETRPEGPSRRAPEAPADDLSPREVRVSAPVRR